MTRNHSTVTAILSPASVALVGASSKPSSIGGRLASRLAAAARGGIRVHLVNPNAGQIEGLPVLRSAREIPEPVDLALIAVPAEAVLAELEAVAEAGAQAAIVFSSGFADVGGGDERQRQLVAAATAGGVRLLGPNCLGTVNLPLGLVATFNWHDATSAPSRVGVVSQSGAMGIHLARMLDDRGIGVSHWVSTGNEADITLGEAVHAVVEDDNIDLCVVLCEALRDSASVRDAAEAARALGKHIICFPMGASEEGGRAALSHTGGLSSDGQAVDAFVDACGMIRAASLSQTVDVVRLLLAGAAPQGGRLGIVTGSGGMGVAACDAAAASGLEVVALGEEQRARLARIVPESGSTANPIDWTAQAFNDPALIGELFSVLASSDWFDAICVASSPVEVLGDRFTLPLRRLAREAGVPVFAIAPTKAVAERVESLGLPCFLDPVAPIGALGRIVAARRTPDRALLLDEGAEGASERLPTGLVDERVGKELLGRYGAPSVAELVVDDRSAASRAAEQLGLPLVLKLIEPDVAHKASRGGVRLGLADVDRVVRAWDELHALAVARPDGGTEAAIVAQPMVSGRLELLCGMTRNASLGPVLTIGLGGVLVELFRETALLLGPVDEAVVRDALADVLDGRLVSGPHALASEELSDLAAVVAAVDRLAREHPEIAEIDVNPIVVGGGRATVVDALLVVGEES